MRTSPPLSIVIPIYNRKTELALCLTALAAQSYKNFEVILSDDGSDDDPLHVLQDYKTDFPFQYVYYPRWYARRSVARNRGAKLALTDFLVFIDSDVLLNPHALQHYANILEANPTAIVAGMYHWLPPMHVSAYDVQYHWSDVTQSSLPPREIEGELQGIVGVDPRCSNPALWNSTVLQSRYELLLFSGNFAISKENYWSIGGFDEGMLGHGGEDCEFAIRAVLGKIRAIFSKEVVGYHVYHNRNQKANAEDVERNVEYIAKKHDLTALGIARGKEGEFPLVYAA